MTREFSRTVVMLFACLVLAGIEDDIRELAALGARFGAEVVK